MSKRHRMPAGGPKSEEESTEMADATIEDSTETTPESAEIAETTEVPETTDAEPTEISEESAEPSEESTESTEASVASEGAKRKIQWPRVFAYGVLPALALLLALAAGFSRWEYISSDNGVVPPVASEQNPSPATESMNAAKDSTIKMLSYKPDTVDQQLNAARDLLTGEFRDSYTSLINDVVIPGAQQKQISAVASVPAAASVSADTKHAVVLVFVNQTVVVGQDPPSDTASSVRVTLEKTDDRWLISEFEPV